MKAFAMQASAFNRAIQKVLILSALLTSLAWANTEPPSPAPAKTTEAFTLAVQTEAPEIAEFLQKHLELQRYRALLDLDDDELTRLLRDADVQARELLATLGFFNAELNWQQKPPALPGGTRSVQLSVVTGPQARISEVHWHWQGDMASNPEAREQQQLMVRQWSLAAGQRFSQSDWSSAKNQALRQLLASRYPWGKLAETQAQVDAANNRVRIDITVDSGPSVRLGPLNVVGADKYKQVQAERLARLTPGKLYSQSDLLEAQQRLVASGFYDSVWVSLEPDSAADAAPVKIELKEALLQKWVLGVGVRSDSGGRLTAEHTHHRVPGLNWRAVTKLALERDRQSLGVDLLAPPDSHLWRLNLSAKLDQEKLTGYQINSQRWRAGRTQHGDRIDRAYFAQYDVAQLQGDLSAHQESISGNVSWTWRQFDSLPFPNRGLGLGIELGSGVTLGTQREPYVRWLVKGLGLLPLGRTAGRLSVRAEMGSVVSRDPSSLPFTQLFLAGGDNSVRGYMPNSIGIDNGNGLVVAGRYMSTGSVEWQRPITWNQLRTDWESAVFADAGAVSNDLQKRKIQLGYGVGVRWRSPVGPVRMDLAYADVLQKLRLHLSVGFTF
jgi:translocation and assembly module TamA